MICLKTVYYYLSEQIYRQLEMPIIMKVFKYKDRRYPILNNWQIVVQPRLTNSGNRKYGRSLVHSDVARIRYLRPLCTICQRKWTNV